MNNFYINELMGVRSWLYNPNHRSNEPNKTQLTCSFGSAVSENRRFWDEGLNVSYCRNGSPERYHPKGEPHRPIQRCGCGIHALDSFSPKTISHRTYLGEYQKGRSNREKEKQDRILGIIKASGHIIVCNYGFRSQKAEIIALVFAPWNRKETENYIYKLALRNNYDMIEYEDALSEEYLKQYAESKMLNTVQDIGE